MPRKFLILGGVLAVVIAAAVWVFTGGYTVKVALPAATNIIAGGTVQVNGFAAGTVKSIKAVDNQAILEIELDRAYAPLHEGAVVKVPWKAVLGERLVDVTDGPSSNAEIPSSGLIKGQMPKPTEVDQVLNALDPKTLDHLKSLINELDATSKGHEGDINATLQALGPTLKGLGGVLDAVGTDGPAIKALVVRLNNLTGTLATHQTDVRAIVTQLSRLTTQAATRQQQLRDGLRKLPGTLRTARTTLDKLPPVADEVVPLLHDLEPATDKLESVSKNLNPLLKDLRPAIRDLGPTLEDLDDLFDEAPDLLEAVYNTFPRLNRTLRVLSDPLDFLRPYTPEAAGWLSNWNSNWAPYDGNGKYARIWYQAGLSMLNANPGIMPPGIRSNPYPLPGENGGTPWKDAFGSGVK